MMRVITKWDLSLSYSSLLIAIRMSLMKLTALQRWVDVKCGLLNPRHDPDEFLDERRHHTLENGRTASARA